MLPHISTWTAGVRGTISRYLVTIPTPSSTYHFYEMDIIGLEQDWPERKERSREMVDYAEAIQRLEWKSELAQALKLSSIAPRRWKVSTWVMTARLDAPPKAFRIQACWRLSSLAVFLDFNLAANLISCSCCHASLWKGVLNSIEKVSFHMDFFSFYFLS